MSSKAKARERRKVLARALVECGFSEEESEDLARRLRVELAKLDYWVGPAPKRHGNSWKSKFNHRGRGQG